MTAAKTPLLRPLVLSVALAAAGLGVGSWYGVATAQSTVQAPAPELVSGLPDFTRLVDQVGPAVVSVQAEIGGKPQAVAQQPDPRQVPDDEEVPEFFRRFFGPGMGPGMPGMPGAPGVPNARPRGVSQGTGFIISGDGYVLTNHHVVDGADTVRIKLSDRREFVAKVVGSDEQSDVALLKIDANGLPTLRIGDSRTLKSGQWVVAIGSPFGLDHSVTAGIVSAVGRANPYADQRYVPGPGGRHQLADFQQFRRLHGGQLRDPDRRGDERGAAAQGDRQGDARAIGRADPGDDPRCCESARPR